MYVDKTLSEYTLHHGDCLDILPTLELQSVDAIICDPPYGTTACKWDSVIPFAPMWAGIRRVLRPRGACVLFGSQPFTSALVMSNVGWYRHSWVWEKDKAANILNANRMPLDVVEDIAVFSDMQPYYNPQKVAVKPYNHKNRGVISANFGRNGSEYDPDGYTIYDTAYPRNILYFAKDDDASHPTQKPLALLEYLVICRWQYDHLRRSARQHG